MKSLRIALAALTAVMLSACASTQGTLPRHCAVMGALLGGVGGTAAGTSYADSHSDDHGIGIGIAAVLLGAGLGYAGCALFYQEEPEVLAIEPTPEPPPVEEPELPAVAARVLEVDPCEEIVILDSVSFPFDEAEISLDGMTILGWIVDGLEQCETQKVRVEAHTDAIGSEDYNMSLSDRRADAVVRFLVEHGIDAGRMTSTSFGESRPIAPNDTPEGRSLNRRVELIPVD